MNFFFQNSKMISRERFPECKSDFWKTFSINIFRQMFFENQIYIPKYVFRNKSKLWEKKLNSKKWFPEFNNISFHSIPAVPPQHYFLPFCLHSREYQNPFTHLIRCRKQEWRKQLWEWRKQLRMKTPHISD